MGEADLSPCNAKGKACSSSSSKAKVFTLRIVPRLLQLPSEIRELIYYHVLVEPPRWNKLHETECNVNYIYDYQDLSPPLQTSVILHPGENYVRAPPVDCPCGKRTGLNFRRTCRQIYRESSKVFLENNVFCFDSARPLTPWIRSLTPQHRALVRHISVARPAGAQQLQLREMDLLSGLRTADIDSDILRPANKKSLRELSCHATTLQRLRIIRCELWRKGGNSSLRHLWILKQVDPATLISEIAENRDAFLEEMGAAAVRARDYFHDFKKPLVRDGPLEVALEKNEPYTAICFDPPLDGAVIAALRRKGERNRTRRMIATDASEHAERQHTLEMQIRNAHKEKVQKHAERKEKQRKEEIKALQPHKAWQAEKRSRRSGIARSKGQAEKAYLDEEISWATEEMDYSE